MPTRMRTKRIRTLPGRGKVYEVKGGGLLSGLRKLAKRSGKTFVAGAKSFGNTAFKFSKNQVKALAPAIAKELGSTLLTAGASKLGEQASKKGVPDFAVNLGSKLAQDQARKLKGSSGPALSKNQKLVSDFISDKSANILGDLLSRGSGVRGFGSGVRGFGGGVRGFSGKGLTAVEAPTIN
jgi:hypothetical protein